MRDQQRKKRLPVRGAACVERMKLWLRKELLLDDSLGIHGPDLIV